MSKIEKQSYDANIVYLKRTRLYSELSKIAVAHGKKLSQVVRMLDHKEFKNSVSEIKKDEMRRRIIELIEK